MPKPPATRDPDDDFLPHNYPVNCFAYTGSHDNNTAQGWYDEATASEQAWCRKYLSAPKGPIAWPMMRVLWASVAMNVVAPMQDLLGLGNEARMNLPGRQAGNWGFRFTWDQVQPATVRRLRELVDLYQR